MVQVPVGLTALTNSIDWIIRCHLFHLHRPREKYFIQVLQSKKPAFYKLMAGVFYYCVWLLFFTCIVVFLRVFNNSQIWLHSEPKDNFLALHNK